MNDELILKAKNLADDLNLSILFVYHKQTGKTTKDAVTALGVNAEYLLKTLILFAPKEQKFIGAILLGTDKICLKKLSRITKTQKILFANPKQIKEVIGFSIGGVPPLAIGACDYQFIDKNVVLKEFVIGAGGTEYCGMKLNPKEMANKTNYKIVDISK